MSHKEENLQHFEQIEFCSRVPSPPIKHWKIIKKFFVELMEIELQSRLQNRSRISLKLRMNNLKPNE